MSVYSVLPQSRSKPERSQVHSTAMSSSYFFSRFLYDSRSRYRGTVASSTTRLGRGDNKHTVLAIISFTAALAALFAWWKEYRSSSLAVALRQAHAVTIAVASHQLTNLHEVSQSNRPDFIDARISGLLAESIYVHFRGKLWVPPNERLTSPLSGKRDVVFYQATVTRKYEQRHTQIERRRVKRGRKATEEDSGSDSEHEEREVVRWLPHTEVAYHRSEGARSVYLDDGTGRVLLARHPSWSGHSLKTVVVRSDRRALCSLTHSYHYYLHPLHYYLHPLQDRFEQQAGMTTSFSRLIGGIASLATGTRTIGYMCCCCCWLWSITDCILTVY
jgi:hypothetical protein